MRTAFAMLAGSLLLNFSATASREIPELPGTSSLPLAMMPAGATLMAPSCPLAQARTIFPASTRTGSIPAGDETLRTCCEKMEKDKRRIFYLNARKGRMSFQVKGIYTRGEAIFFLLSLRNHSYIDFDVDSIRFYEADKWGTPLRSPVHPPIRIMRAIYTYGNTKLIHGKSQELAVIALPRFTLPEGKRLVIEVTEKNGGRNLHLFTDNFTLLRARLI